MPKYTAFCQDISGNGTIWIEAFTASDEGVAVAEARRRCAADWDYDPQDVHVLGIAKGDVKILYWEDLNA